MKIVMLCEFYKEGLEYQENLLTKYYVKNGHEVVVITSTFDSVFNYYSAKHNSSIPAREYEDNGAKIIKLKFVYNFFNKLKRYTSIYPILEREQPDLIFIHDIMPNMNEGAKYIKKHPNCRMIMDYHADYSNSGKNILSLKILHGFIRKIFFLNPYRKYLSKIFPIVPAGFTFLHEIYGIPFSEMELLPLGADTETGATIRSAKEGEKIRSHYGILKSDFVIFTGGKLSERKKTELLISAVNEMTNPSIHLFIIGDSSEENREYKSMLISLASINKNIRFIGWLKNEEVYKYMDAADIAVFPASQSIMWQQSISMGLPLIVGNTGNQSISYLNEYKNIIILESDSITIIEIKKNILQLFQDEKLVASMKKGALKITDKMLNWNHLINKTLRFNN